MKNFKSLQARHEELINKVQANEDVLDQAQELIADIKKESSHISSLSERDQLMANLRYWASYVYEKSGNYPNVELSPSTTSPQPKWITPLVIIGVVAVLLFFFWGTLAKESEPPETTPTESALLPSSSVTSTPLPTYTPYPTFTPVAIFFTPTEIEATQVSAISIEITSVREGDEVQPLTILRGTYSNLPFGYSVHVIVQPKGGFLYPMKQFATVSPNSSTGSWEIEGRFGQGADLKKEEEYQIQLVAAMNDDGRQALLNAVNTGMQSLPSNVIPFPQTIIVKRPASTDFVSGLRMIYSSFLDVEGNYEIFTSETDGTDVRRITYTSGFNEYFPSLSPDGTKIAYAGRGMNENNVLVQSIDVMNSNGTEVKTIVQNQLNVTYENPLWSSDGRYIAFSVGTPRKNQPAYWNIYVYDLQENQEDMVTKGETTSNRYYSWIPNTYEIVFDARVSLTGTSGFMKMDVQNPDAVSLYFDGKNEELQPAVSPDGKLLAYTQLDDQFGNIYVVDLSTNRIVQLTFGDFFDSRPTWSPNGKTIFFDSAETEFINIWSVNVDGSNLTQITFEKSRYPFVGVMHALIPK